MSTPTDAQLAQTALDQFKLATATYAEWEKEVAKGAYNPKDGSGTHVGQVLAALNQIIGGTPPPPPPPPPSGAGNLIGLYLLGSGSQGFKHVNDGTYALNIGPWPALNFLASLNNTETYVYTVLAGTPGATDPPYTLLDPSNPQAYINAVLAYVKGTNVGVFCDNILLEMSGVTAAVQTVGATLKKAGVNFGINLGSYVSGNPDSDTGVLWQQRVALVGPYCTACMLENWQEFSGGPNAGQNRTTQNGGNWTSWQNCPAAAAKAGTRMVAVTYGGDSNLTWGRASLLTAPGVDVKAVLATGAEGNTDPYDTVWTKPNPSPVLNQQTGTATL